MSLYIDCAFCRGRFIPARSTARFCSAKCRVYWNRASKLPKVMADRKAWVRADGKRPVTVDGRPASTTDPTTWSSLAEVLASRSGDGYGVMLGAGLGCYDLDDVSDADARDFIAEIQEPVLFVERSMSGRGFHVFMEAAEGKGWKRGNVERYTRERFIRVTRDVFTV